jgi:hypothetical protein
MKAQKAVEVYLQSYLRYTELVVKFAVRRL